ncbi:hypothetical protein CDCA_CDCA14G3903 [Cyanidium caldarium]|uniref:C2 NT-type domain-containing protein n=1 Tax=Cyanidium caldarium TaxID=2771 RepID=A0AAV9J0L3_CYACA|nr:hypothetical protein CDCA_CDCA14G3903 [Cyanidium caldarium]|eukprot:ctg_616.g273
MSSGFRRVTVQVKEIKDIPVGSFPKRVYVRTRLDTATPLRGSDETTFATNVLTISKKTAGPYTFYEESGDANVFALPDFTVVCDVHKVGGGCFQSGADERIATVRIPLSKIEIENGGKQETWYSLHYPSNVGGMKKRLYAGSLLLSIQIEQRLPRTFNFGAFRPVETKSPEEHSPYTGEGAPAPVSPRMDTSADSSSRLEGGGVGGQSVFSAVSADAARNT